jgi:CubicO group peptidase (beta-lactamase class C family)
VLRLTFALFVSLPVLAQAPLDGIDSLITSAMKDWGVPSAAVAVVRGGEVIYLKGYGSVTPKTQFATGSVTKPFTALALGVLADEGKLDWDTPIRKYFPAFRLNDAFATERATMRDLLTHRAGLPAGLPKNGGPQLTPAQLVERLRYLEAAADFRSEFRYGNLGYIAAGYIGGEVAGTSWEELVRSRIFGPLGMKSSNLSAEGEIRSNAEDMAQFLLVELGAGKPIVSAKTLAEMQRPQVVTGSGSQFPELAGTNAYGLGWGILRYREYKMVEHGSGSTSEALVSLLPEKKIGVAVLTNSGRHPVCTVIALNVYDRLLGLNQAPWNERFLKMRAGADGKTGGR